jgi:ABC-type bacteriocin/lantibiotic exporter with double-glycine peptidase domain
MSWGFYLFSAMAFSILISSLLQWYQQKVLVRLYIKLSTRFACETFWHMLRLPVSFYNQRYPGEIAYRMVLNDFVSRNATNSLVPALLNILMVLFYGIAMFYYDPVIATIAIVASILNILMLRRVTRSRKDAYGKFQVDMGRSTSYSLGIINNIETIKATGLEFKFFPNWAGYYTKVVNNLQEIGNKNVFLSAAGPLISSLTTAAFIGIGGWRIINGQLTVGMFIALQILMRLFMSPISQLLQLSQSFQFLKVDLARLDDIMNHPTDPLLEQNKAPIEEFTHKIEGFAELKNVDFGYSPLEEPLLKNINFTLHPGKRIALVGATGCGKSTIAKLLAGIFYPRHGEVLFDGKPRAEIPRHILTSSLAFVEQEPFLFSGTIRENITLMDSTIKQEDVINAAKDACIHEDIMARKGGYDLMLEENGLNLSGGQRQRLEIARGLVKNPTILILDESTSALDSETEIQIIKNINRRGCAVLMIAHRLSSIRNCDEIYVLDKGHVVDVGTHNQLKKSSMIYKTLVESEHLNVEE